MVSAIVFGYGAFQETELRLLRNVSPGTHGSITKQFDVLDLVGFPYFPRCKGSPIVKLVGLKIDKFITVSRKEKLIVKILLLTLTKRNWPSAVKTITPLRPFVKAPPKNSKTENTEICTCLFFFYLIFIIHACKYLFQYYICYKTLFFSVEIYLTDI